MAMTKAELETRVKELAAQLEANKDGDIITFKVSQRGAVSVYGLGRLPVTLYKTQWERLLDHQRQLRTFCRKTPTSWP